MDAKRPIHSTIELFKSPIYVLGCVVATTSWGFHVAALALAPISVVQSVIAGGLVLVTVVADRFFGHHVHAPRVDRGRRSRRRASRSWRRRSRARPTRRTRTTTRWCFGVTLAATTIAAIVLVIRNGTNGPALAVSAGLLWAGSDITIKAVTGHSGIGVSGAVFAAIIVVWSLVALLISAKSLQLGPVVAVIALTSATANVITIAAGPVVFQEPLPEDTGALLLRLAAFALVITAAAMTPPPGRELKKQPA